jgi:uncharacterized protein YdiU (UPF0061 family)
MMISSDAASQGDTAGDQDASDTRAILGWRFDHSYARLPEAFFSHAGPTPVRAPRLVLFNHALAGLLGLSAGVAGDADLAALLAGNVLPEGALPIAQAYAGHQFGHFTMLGDGRAVLLGEHIAPDGRRFDIQFKGSGPTPYSRRGDGRAALGPMLREYLVSEAMHALGIPTTRSLAVVATGEPVRREEMLPGAILTRVASSHIRVGTFQYAAARRDSEGLAALVAHCIARHDPDLAGDPAPALRLLGRVIERQVDLIVGWMRVGFVHGVMNTDNMTVSGETIDYGPCAFMDAYDPATVFSSIDHGSRYAFGNQPQIAQWNLARLAEALLALIDPDPERAVALATDQVRAFSGLYETRWLAMMRGKLGLQGEEAEDRVLVVDLLDWMRANGADYTNTFRALSAGKVAAEGAYGDAGFRSWQDRWQARLSRNGAPLDAARSAMRAANPAYIPRNHLVEAALAAAGDGDLGPLHGLIDVLAHPYDERPGLERYAESNPLTCGYQTFCGT